MLENFVFQYFELGLTTQQIAAGNSTLRTAICERTVRNAINRYNETGIVNHQPREGVRRARQIAGDVRAELILIVTENPWLFLSEIAAALQLRASGSTLFSVDTVYSALCDLGMSMKLMQRTAAQLDNDKRKAYWLGLDTFISDWRMLVFADETALDGRVMRRRRGWGSTSERVRIVEIFHRGEMISVLPLYTHEGFARYTYSRGAFDSDKFMRSMHLMLPLVLRPVPNPCSVLVLDNCAIHKKYEDELRALVEGMLGGVLVYLAPYCCIDSPIEYGFNAFKNTWKANSIYLDSLNQDAAIQWAILNAYKGGAVGSARAARGTYATCGYVKRYPSILGEEVQSREYVDAVLRAHLNGAHVVHAVLACEAPTLCIWKPTRRRPKSWSDARDTPQH